MSNPLRKTLEFLGLAEENPSADYDPRGQGDHHAPQTVARTNVTPLRRGRNTPDVNEILTVHPKKYEDAKLIAETFREGIPVIMNLTHMSETEARRLVDFSSGLTQGLYGHIERVTPKVFLLSPSHVQVSAEAEEDPQVASVSLMD